MKVLVAEDEDNIAFTYRVMIEHSGHTVTMTSDGEQCLKAYKNAMALLLEV